MNNKFNSIYVSHDTPRSIIINNDPTKLFFESFSKEILNDIKPKAILLISAHWEADEFTIQTNDNPSIIYDFNNFPNEMYQLKYQAKTCPILINRVIELFNYSNIKLKQNKEIGYDHGCWIICKMIYPNADVPIVQLSLKSSLNPIEHYKMGQILTPLLNEGYLVLGSGGTVHNLNIHRDVSLHKTNQWWAFEFEQWIDNILTNKQGKEREDEILKFESLSISRLSHPTFEHIIPLFVSLGCAPYNSIGKRIHCYWRNIVFCASSYIFK